ncbi:chalcone and stilbene synthase domain-containing protein [Microdochium trichocladiopsis]|uniref:Chalcone and stilbene synthase domain-containing protein n=1 Tax=Microdochium trichocladiopsis TaxID=1682393 RepID=A0A9P8YIF2_9PEZI|nr:chalcone and stilbene synthase domain-containing protein [Microdochium trichocladiopsis]KAH7040865.1 chalcone and stilbene synthase domain-containing protein [Microdochium trichocladiopsis]
MALPAELGNLQLSILGLGVQYPPYSLTPDELGKLARTYYPDSPSMRKVIGINQMTGIEKRSSIGTAEHPLVNQPTAPSIAQLHEVFMSDGVPLAVEAARKALAEANLGPADITHVVSTTCTDSANPGFDHYVAKELGLSHSVEKVLLHGIGCSGGLAVLRTSANLALGHTFRRKPARVLCIALEVSTTLARSELDSIHELQETRIGACLFSDCASASILSNGLGGDGEDPEPVYTLLGWQHETLPDSQDDLGFQVDPLGWKVVLTPNVPKLAMQTLASSFAKLVDNSPQLPPDYSTPADFDWAMHPGGATILTGAEKTMAISSEHMRASYDVYMNHGNSSSATIFSVLDRLRQKDMDAVAPEGRVRDFIVGCAFGPGITVETCMLKRHKSAAAPKPGDIPTPPDTDSEAGASESGEASDWMSDGRGSPVATTMSAVDPSSKPDETFIEEAISAVELD